MRKLNLVAFIVCIALWAGCSQVDEPDAAATPVNALCPIMGHEVNAEGKSTTWKGQTIGFCCDGCLPKWDALSDEDRAAKLAEASQAEPEDHGS